LWWPLVTDPTTYNVTGALTPDVTGAYNLHGTYFGVPYYKLDAQEWYLWSPFPGRWIIGATVGELGDPYWMRMVSPPLIGDYQPMLTALGVATVSPP